jgi:hypothetical protein
MTSLADRIAIPAGPGRRILGASWFAVVIVVVPAVVLAAGVHALSSVVAVISLSAFGVGFVVWLVAFGRAIARSTTEEIAVANWVFLSGSAPAPVRAHLLGAAGVMLVGTVATTAPSRPFAWLANLLPLAFAALWGARHGTFPPRATPAPGARRR